MSVQISAKTIERAIRAGACQEGIEAARRAGTWDRFHTVYVQWAALNVELPDAEREEVFRLCGSRAWWRDGKRHRDDGPAVECVDGTQWWWVNGKRVRAQQAAAGAAQHGE